MPSLNYIYYNELKLDKENNFQMNTTENNAVDNVEFIAGEEHRLSTCSLQPKKENDIKNGMIKTKLMIYQRKLTSQEKI